jgi:phosphatidylserine/phosphatidylglycerophosphate/cardiolipin synthase-like enzyme
LLLAALPLAPPARAAALAVCFAPPLPGGCDAEATVLDAIAAARRTVRMQIYAFTSRPILAALVAARRRGVVVRAIVDRGQFHDDRNDTQAVRRLAAAGVPVFVDSVPGLMHDKIMIIDDATVLTGSFNYTWSAEHRNAENLVTIRDPAVVGAYLRNWRARLAESRPLAGATDPPTRPAAMRQEAGRQAAEDPTGAVRGNRNTRIYQWPGCRYYDRIGMANRVAFPSAAAAQAAGYRAARNCR